MPDIKANIFKIQRFSTQDGPGIRTTIFFKGCSLRCKWCHNPEGISSQKDIIFRENLCTFCQLCVRNCTEGAHVFKDGRHYFNRKVCRNCGECVRACPTGALSFAGSEVNVDEVMKIVLKDLVYYRESDGGVTFSGGEPLLQAKFIHSLMDECKKYNIPICLDTCGHINEEIFEEAVKRVDHILFDLKAMDSNVHKELTGYDNTLILKNFAYACSIDKYITVRVIVVPGLNDDEENYRAMSNYLKESSFKGSVELMGYHTFGISKYEQLGIEYSIPEIQLPSKDKMLSIEDYFKKQGFKTKIN